MASNLFVINGSGSNASVQAFGSPQSAKKPVKESGFADLLNKLSGNDTPPKDAPSAVATATQKPKTSELSSSATALTNAPAALDGDASEGHEEDIGAEATEAVAAPTTPALPIDTTQVLALVEQITALRSDLAAGKTVDPELLTQINASLQALAGQLGLDLDALPAADDLASLLNSTGEGDTSAKGLFATLIKSLEAASSQDGLTQQKPETGDAVKQITDTLSKILSAMDSAEIDDNKLASLGLAADKPRPNDLEQALVRLAKASSEQPAGPVLASPSLTLTEELLSGKADDATAQAGTVTSTGKSPSEGSDNADNSRDQKDQPVVIERPAASTLTATMAEIAPASTQVVDAATPAVQNLNIDAAALRTIAPAYTSSQQQLNLPQIAFEMARQMEGGVNRFQIRLDPPEMGRIDVRLDIDQNGNLNAKLIVEKPETLDMMQRDQRALERALQQAGIDAHRATLEFSLKQNDQQSQRDTYAFERNEGDSEPTDVDADSPPQVTLYRGNLQASGLNILA